MSKKGLGLSLGPAHSKISLSPRGRLTANLGIPGTGIRYTKRVELEPHEAKHTHLTYTDQEKDNSMISKEPTKSEPHMAEPTIHLDIPGDEGVLETEVASTSDEEFVRKYSFASTREDMDSNPTNADYSGLVDINMLRQYAHSKTISPNTLILDTYTGIESKAEILLGTEAF